MAFMHTWTTHRSTNAIILLHIISLLFKAMPLCLKCFSKQKEEAKLNSLNSQLIKELASSRGPGNKNNTYNNTNTKENQINK